MALPPNVDSKIRSRLEKLVQDTEILVNTTDAFTVVPKEAVLFHALRTNFIALLGTFGNNNTCKSHLSELKLFGGHRDNVKVSEAHRLVGMVLGFKGDYEADMLYDLTEMIEAEISADYLGQAQQLLKEGVTGNFEHIPAAVLTGAIFEDGLRRLCVRNGISLVDTKGNSKTLNPMIDDLKKVNLYNELKAKQLRSWADIRNAAAHGEFAKFNKQDVEGMLVGVQNFLADYL